MVVGNETASVLKRTGVFEDGRSLRVGTTSPDAPYPFRRWLRPGESWRSADGRIANLHTPGSRDATACYGTGWKDYIGGIIASHAKEYGLSYIKLDLAIATSAYIYDSAWSGCYAKDHPGHRDRPESFDVIYSNCLGMFDRVHRDARDAR